MYHFPHQSIVHSGYEHCNYFGAPTVDSAFSTEKNEPAPVLAVSSNTSVSSGPPQGPDPLEIVSSILEPSTKSGKAKASSASKEDVDGSNFTVEQRAVAAVWVHERLYTKNSLSEIKRHFEQRFGRSPPAKNTMLLWERKLFATGSVHDAPRPGRPARRKLLEGEVRASLRSAPGLSMRARAAALGVPRSTMRALLRRGFLHEPGVADCIRPAKKKKQKKQKAQQPASPAPAPSPAPARGS